MRASSLAGPCRCTAEGQPVVDGEGDALLAQQGRLVVAERPNVVGDQLYPLAEAPLVQKLRLVIQELLYLTLQQQPLQELFPRAR